MADFFHDKLSREFDAYKNKQKIQEAVAYMRENYARDLNMAVVSNQKNMQKSAKKWIL